MCWIHITIQLRGQEYFLGAALRGLVLQTREEEAGSGRSARHGELRRFFSL